MKATTAQKNAIAAKHLTIRLKFWPSVKDEEVWNRRRKQGFTTIPRTMSLFKVIMDSICNRKPVSSVYFELWCRAFDEHIVRLNNQREMAFHSGYTGERAIQTWSSRIDALDKLGFIKLAPGPDGIRSYALIMNPYIVIQKLYKKKTPGITAEMYNALVARAAEIKADDI